MKRSTALALLFVGLVAAANWLTAAYGMLGNTVLAGTFAAGLTFAVRDLLHETGGRKWVLGAIAGGATLSAWLAGPALAVASAAAFASSEAADYAVYAPLRKRSTGWAMLLSNTVGAAADSLLFLWLAGYPLDAWGRQALVKVAVTLPVIAVALLLRNRRTVVVV